MTNNSELRLATIQIDAELPEHSEGLSLALESILWQPLPPDPSAGRGITVLLLGLAVNPRHPCLRGRIYETPQLHPSSTTSLEIGNALASLINGRGECVRGIAPRARVTGISLPLKDQKGLQGSGTLSVSGLDLADAIEHVLQLAPRIILLPFESEADNPALNKSLQRAAALGIIVLAPAGAARLDHSAVPARHPAVISVNEGDDWTLFASANAAMTPALRAPNHAPVASGIDSEGLAQGPLVALAIAAGAVAALWSLAPSLSRDALLRILRSGRSPLSAELIDQSLPIDLAAWAAAVDPDGQALLIHEPRLLPTLAPPNSPRQLRLALENCGIQRIDPTIDLHDESSQLLRSIPTGPLLPGERRDLSASLTLQASSKPRSLKVMDGTEVLARLGAISLRPRGFPGDRRWTAALRLAFGDCEAFIPQLRVTRLALHGQGLEIHALNTGLTPIRSLRIELYRDDRPILRLDSEAITPTKAFHINLPCPANGQLEELLLCLDSPGQSLRFALKRHWR